MEPNPCFRPHSGARQMRDEQNDNEVLYNKVSLVYICTHRVLPYVILFCRLLMNMAWQITLVRLTAYANISQIYHD